MYTKFAYSFFLIACLLQSTPSIAHVIPWNEMDSAFDIFRENSKPELAYHMARYCYIVDKKPKDCIRDVLFKNNKIEKKKTLTAYATCMQAVKKIHPRLENLRSKVNVHKPKNNCRRDDKCRWHLGYVKNSHKEGNGDHRHELHKIQIGIIAERYAHKTVMDFINNYDPKLDLNNPDSKLGEIINVSFNPKKFKEHKITQSDLLLSPSLKKRSRVYKKAYDMAMNNPWGYMNHNKVTPSILCKKNKKYCIDWGATDRPLNADYSCNQKKPTRFPKIKPPIIASYIKGNVSTFKREISSCVKKNTESIIQAVWTANKNI